MGFFNRKKKDDKEEDKKKPVEATATPASPNKKPETTSPGSTGPTPASPPPTTPTPDGETKHKHKHRHHSHDDEDDKPEKVISRKHALHPEHELVYKIPNYEHGWKCDICGNVGKGIPVCVLFNNKAHFFFFFFF